MASTTGRKRSKYLQDNGVVTEVTVFDYLVGYRSPTVDILEDTGDNTGIPLNLITLYKKVEVTAALLKASGTTPVNLLPSPGAGKFHSPSKIVVSRAGGGVAYDFDDSIYFGSEGGDQEFFIDAALFNTVGELNLNLTKQGQQQISNVPYILSLVGGSGSDSPTGDRNIDVEIYYTIHNVKT